MSLLVRLRTAPATFVPGAVALGPVAGGWLYDSFGSYAWLFVGSSAIGVGAVAIAFTFRPPRTVPAALPVPSVAS